MFTSPHECGLCTHHIRTSTDLELLYLAEWLCPTPFAPPNISFYVDTPMLVYDVPFILATLSLDQEVIIFQTTCLFINAI